MHEPVLHGGLPAVPQPRAAAESGGRVRGEPREPSEEGVVAAARSPNKPIESKRL